MPFNTHFGNREPVVELLDKGYEESTERERWQAGDLMLVDNVRTAHAREPFEGPRKVLVAMADAARPANSSPTIKTTGGYDRFQRNGDRNV